MQGIVSFWNLESGYIIKIVVIDMVENRLKSMIIWSVIFKFRDRCIALENYDTDRVGRNGNIWIAMVKNWSGIFWRWLKKSR